MQKNFEAIPADMNTLAQFNPQDMLEILRRAKERNNTLMTSKIEMAQAISQTAQNIRSALASTLQQQEEVKAQKIKEAQELAETTGKVSALRGLILRYGKQGEEALKTLPSDFDKLPASAQSTYLDDVLSNVRWEYRQKEEKAKVPKFKGVNSVVATPFVNNFSNQMENVIKYGYGALGVKSQAEADAWSDAQAQKLQNDINLMANKTHPVLQAGIKRGTGLHGDKFGNVQEVVFKKLDEEYGADQEKYYNVIQMVNLLRQYNPGYQINIPSNFKQMYPPKIIKLTAEQEAEEMMGGSE